MTNNNCAYGHMWRIVGSPRSAMTYRECIECGKVERRGEGLFHEQASREQNEAEAIAEAKRGSRI